MTMLVSLLVLAVFAAPVLADLDPDQDVFGVYFDTAGNMNSIMTGPFVPITAYVLLLNPAGPTNGCEFSVTRTGAEHFVLSTSCACEMADGCTIEGDDYWIVCGSDFPVPSTDAVVLVTWSIMLAEHGGLLFYIGPSSIPSLPDGLPVLTGNGVLRPGAVASGDVDMPVACVNCFLSSAEASAFGSVKSLFR